MIQSRILIIHPEPSILALLGSMLHSLGHQIDEASNDRAAVRRMERGGIDLVIAGIDPFDPEALELLSFSRRKYPQVPVILLFPNANPERAREATRMGAAAVLKFPMPATELRAAVTQACEQPHLSAASNPASNSYSGSMNGTPSHRSTVDPSLIEPAQQGKASIENGYPRNGSSVSLPAAISLPNVLGEDPTLRQAVDLAATVAPARATVLIVGEQGTGKSLIARSIHQQSSRRDQPFLEVSCAGIDELGLERELFGQRFEGESSERAGRLARADRGTLLLDEVAALSPSLQSRLLRVLVDGEFEPMGSTQSIQVDVRFILATRENLPSLVEQGKFRRDLFERINGICLKLPSLRQRGHDVIQLADHFRDRFSREFGKPVVGFTPDAQDLLLRHDWPGNVRELESVVQRGVALSQGPRVTSANLAVGIAPARSSRPSAYAPRMGMHVELNSLRPLKEALEEPEKQIIIAALRALNWNRQETARVLDINRTTLYKKMKKYGLLMEEPALLN
ncbi:sigma-54-dependent transcriptional regulator [Tundrisphaera lichenicola]|uniref:sigma-54-dependent transcriptional regulator n=1 Tax=Tundrisphaera lichenicola TaxID=2029860 RepID=UPI003EBB686D